jgi:hypothetical protein
MKRSFSEALQHMLVAREIMLSAFKDDNASRGEKDMYQTLFQSACKELDDAHKISLLDLIKDSEDAAQ